jgi:HAE1 family hydrophobic/amphiphilic exporter-1
MIMAAQFESFWQPFLIMLTIPLSLIGMAPALLVTGKSLSVMAGVGLVLLCGIVVNNGIVLIDFVNQERERGLSLRDALWSGCHTRLRPIMMTAFTTVLGLMPLAIGFGREAQMQSPMAIVVVSGFFVSTCLTLLVLPALFIITEEKIFKRKD